jgi:hypothetical protein
MKKILLLTTVLTALALPAFAADMPVKAAPTPFLTVNGSGWYWGIGTTSAVDQTNVNNNVFATSLVSNDLTAAGQSIDLEGGYIWGNASIAGIAQWARAYVSGSFQNISGGVSTSATPTTGAASFGVASRWSSMQGVDVGADLVSLLMTRLGIANPFPAFNPTQALPSAAMVAATPREYFGAFVTEFGITGTGLAQGAGTSVGVAPGVRTGYLWQTIDSTGKPNGGALDLGVAVDWPTRGVTFSNLFATNGAPLTLNASANIGTQYKAYIRYDF